MSKFTSTRGVLLSTVNYEVVTGWIMRLLLDGLANCMCQLLSQYFNDFIPQKNPCIFLRKWKRSLSTASTSREKGLPQWILLPLQILLPHHWTQHSFAGLEIFYWIATLSKIIKHFDF